MIVMIEEAEEQAKFCVQLPLREIENKKMNVYAKFWKGQQQGLWYF